MVSGIAGNLLAADFVAEFDAQYNYTTYTVRYIVAVKEICSIIDYFIIGVLMVVLFMIIIVMNDHDRELI